MQKLTLALFFGGRSTEHEVSVITTIQAYNNLDLSKYDVIPIYVSKHGDFYTNPKFLKLENYKDIGSLLLSSKKVVVGRNNGRGGFFVQGLFSKFIPFDLAFPLFHGSFGEDGCIQGLFEMYQIPYVGFNVTASAMAMDKIVSKVLFKELDLPVSDYFEVKRADWLIDSKKILKQVSQKLKFPLFVKPATIGSSIGVNKALDADSLNFAIEVAFTYSEKVLIEPAFENVIEVNCSVLGYENVLASVCEMPVPTSEILSFADKYEKGGSKESKSAGMASLSRVIPAPISEKLSKQIQQATIKIFKALDGCGVARVDYFVEVKGDRSSRRFAPQDDTSCRFWVNEINSPPGSLSFYLWEKTGIKYKELLDMLIDFALKRTENQNKTQFTFESGLLSKMATKGGIKN